MTKRELVEKLSSFDDQAPVFFIDDLSDLPTVRDGNLEIEDAVEIHREDKKTIVLIGE